MVERLIKTFVIFDLETTGLMRRQNLPKITEIAMVAVSRESMCTTDKPIPRVLQKLLLPVNPKIALEPKAAEITKLSNTMLNNVAPFEDKMFSVINNFIDLLEKPICLVAHNGIRFDYPILLAELKTINQSFSQEVLTVDTLKLFKDYYKQVQIPQQLASSLTDDGWDAVLCDAVDKINEDLTKMPEMAMLEEHINESLKQLHCMASTSAANYAEAMQQANEKTPEHQIIGRKKRNYVVRRLDFCDETPTHRKSMVPDSYSLMNIYNHMFKTDMINAHSAEDDCIALLQCVCKIRDYAVNWIDENAVPLNEHAARN